MSVSTARQVKIAVIVVALVAAAGLFWFRGRELPVVSNTVKVVCVETGKLFDVKRGSIAIYPGRNPETGRDTLVPAEVGDDGVVRVQARALGALEGLKELNKCVDPKTGVVRRG